MFIENLKHGEVRPGDIVIWQSGEKESIPGNSDLVVSVKEWDNNITYNYLELRSLRLWTSRVYHIAAPCLYAIFRAEL